MVVSGCLAPRTCAVIKWTVALVPCLTPVLWPCFVVDLFEGCGVWGWLVSFGVVFVCFGSFVLFCLFCFFPHVCSVLFRSHERPA